MLLFLSLMEGFLDYTTNRHISLVSVFVGQVKSKRSCFGRSSRHIYELLLSLSFKPVQIYFCGQSDPDEENLMQSHCDKRRMTHRSLHLSTTLNEPTGQGTVK